MTYKSDVEIFETRLEDGTLVWKTELVGGRRHGVQEHYRNDGSILWKKNCCRGRLHGVQTYYNPDGSIKKEDYFINGRIQI
jgi:antitoxin component YwqK of YwqJK toxin-antitoxin module